MFSLVSAGVGVVLALGLAAWQRERHAPLGDLAEQIVTSLRTAPDDWMDLKHTLKHQPTQIEVWHASKDMVSIWQHLQRLECFNRRERRAIWRAGVAWRKTSGEAELTRQKASLLEQLRATGGRG